MTGHRISVQEDLFDVSKPQSLRRRIRELDGLITKAMKRNDYEQAKSLTEEQKRFIQELVAMGETNIIE